MAQGKASGPLTGVRIIEFLGIGPGPYACMLLSDMGADVVTLARKGQWQNDARQFVNRGRTVGRRMRSGRATNRTAFAGPTRRGPAAFPRECSRG